MTTGNTVLSALYNSFDLYKGVFFGGLFHLRSLSDCLGLIENSNNIIIADNIFFAMANILSNANGQLIQKTNDVNAVDALPLSYVADTETDAKAGSVYCHNSRLNKMRTTNGDLQKRVYKVVLTGGK